MLQRSNDGTHFSTITGVLVTDTTGGWQLVPPIGNVHEMSPPADRLRVPAPSLSAITGETIKAGDAVTVLLAGVTNPSAQTVSDFRARPMATNSLTRLLRTRSRSAPLAG